MYDAIIRTANKLYDRYHTVEENNIVAQFKLAIVQNDDEKLTSVRCVCRMLVAKGRPYQRLLRAVRAAAIKRRAEEHGHMNIADVMQSIIANVTG